MCCSFDYFEANCLFFSATATGAAYQAGQAGYAVAAPATAAAAAAAATYGTQRAAGYDTAYQAAAAASQGTYAAVSTGATPAYEYGYGNTSILHIILLVLR